MNFPHFADLTNLNRIAATKIIDPSASVPNEYNLAGIIASDIGRPILGKILGSAGDAITLWGVMRRIPADSFGYSIGYECKDRCMVNDVWLSDPL